MQQVRITELVPGRKVVWHVLDHHFSFTKDATEWKGTDIIFEVLPKDGRTQVRFVHVGLTPGFKCSDACSDGWGNYVGGSLKSLIETCTGQPNVGDAITDSERTLNP